MIILVIVLGFGFLCIYSPITVLRLMAYPSSLFINLQDYSKYPNKKSIDKIVLLYSDPDQFSVEYSSLLTKIRWNGIFLFLFAGLIIFALIVQW